MSLEPWIETDHRRCTRKKNADGKLVDSVARCRHFVRYRDANGTQRHDPEGFRYAKWTDATARKTIIRDRLTNNSLGKVDMSRSLTECIAKYVKFLEDSGSTQQEVAPYALKKFKEYRDDSGNLVIRSLGDLTRHNILDFMTSLIAEGLARHTVQTYMGQIRAWLRWCVDREWLPESPYKEIRVKTPEKIDRSLSNQELQDCEDNISAEEFRFKFRLGYVCGLRPGEVLRVKPEHARWDDAKKEGELYVPRDENKTETGRFVPISREMYLSLSRGVGCAEWSAQRLKRNFNALKIRAHIKPKVLIDKERKVHQVRTYHKTIYWCRHSYGRRELERGVDLKIVSTRMGHKSIEITADVYGHYVKENVMDRTTPSCIQPQKPSAGQLRGNSGQINDTQAETM